MIPLAFLCPVLFLGSAVILPDSFKDSWSRSGFRRYNEFSWAQCVWFFSLTPGCQFYTHFPDGPYIIAGLRGRKTTTAPPHPPPPPAACSHSVQGLGVLIIERHAGLPQKWGAKEAGRSEATHNLTPKKKWKCCFNIRAINATHNREGINYALVHYNWTKCGLGPKLFWELYPLYLSSSLILGP